MSLVSAHFNGDGVAPKIHALTSWPATMTTPVWVVVSTASPRPRPLASWARRPHDHPIPRSHGKTDLSWWSPLNCWNSKRSKNNNYLIIHKTTIWTTICEIQRRTTVETTKQLAFFWSSTNGAPPKHGGQTLPFVWDCCGTIIYGLFLSLTETSATSTYNNTTCWKFSI